MVISTQGNIKSIVDVYLGDWVESMPGMYVQLYRIWTVTYKNRIERLEPVVLVPLYILPFVVIYM